MTTPRSHLAASSGAREQQYSPGGVEITLIIPCLNEAATIRDVIADAAAAMTRLGYTGEILVVDAGSSDGSRQLARVAGARGIEEARGEFLVIIDADRTYSCDTLHRFVEPLRAGLDIVVGTRRNGEIRPGAMTGWHRHVWEPMQTFLLRRRFGVQASDVRCGMRSLTRAAARRLAIRVSGKEFSTEMLARAARAGMQTIDVPVTFHPRKDGTPRRRVRDSLRVIGMILSAASDRV